MEKRKRRRGRQVKARPPVTRKAERTQQTLQTTPPHRRLLSAAMWLVGTLVAIVGLASALYTVWGPIWPTWPDIHPVGNDPGRPFSLPFSLTNRSVIFRYDNIRLGCVMKNVLLITKENSNAIFGVPTGVPQKLAPQHIANFRCGVSASPDYIASAEIRIALYYSIPVFGFEIPLQYKTIPFSWMATSNGGLWIAGTSK